MRQIGHETHGVGQHRRHVVVELEAPERRVQRREELVRRVHAGLRERVEQRRLARVRVTDERHRGDLVAQPVASPELALTVHLLEPRDELADTLANGFEISQGGNGRACANQEG